MPLMRDRAKYWRNVMLVLGLLVIGIYIVLDQLMRTSIGPSGDLSAWRFYVDILPIWVGVTYLVGIPSLSVGITLTALLHLEA
jgi:hypothetical protein